ncbi:hypothetical protein EJ070_31665 [Mesorhizobium sp. M1E.F.Ca.ET.045.02.1.1]|uniref:DUF5343 domain-containing protein n=1 Tax=Mesorhizobium sp. M1E.F.Ca.ET.045.02.1.1 TaxID=2493672 RepID=UPI000F755FDD|nr:DUF5343 domain-containing protein [Mesorhizobium sp. M1E.F.Ca.ET.045.02.1.1]AZO24777.1 hypothetical protein EJ070_31665 [Mesorhizobium sp. M1E.F.Ca.ET.045.02.1.1]
MALLNQSVATYGQISKLLEALRQGQAPDKFTRQFLKDKGFTSSNHHAFIPLLKGLGFLNAEGTPTQRYKDFLDSTKWKQVVAEAIKEAYSDIFILKAKPTKADKNMIAGKYKSAYNLSEQMAERSASTFLALLDLADEHMLYGGSAPAVAANFAPAKEPEHAEVSSVQVNTKTAGKPSSMGGLHYNIQIHLPATKDVEVYNAIFKSVKEHLID